MKDFLKLSDWFSASTLLTRLEGFFAEEGIPKTLTHLYWWLGVDWIEFDKKKTNEEFRDLLIGAELFCECWVVSHGFENDKSFARYYLENNHKKAPTDNGEGKITDRIEIVVRGKTDAN